MAGYRPGGEEGGGMGIQRYLAALKRYRILIVALTAVGVIVGAALTQVIKPVYEAQASIQIPVTPRGGAQRQNLLASSPLLEGRGWLELLRSFAVLDEVVLQRKLYLEMDTPADSIFFNGFGLKEGFVPGAYRFMADPPGRASPSCLLRGAAHRHEAGGRLARDPARIPLGAAGPARGEGGHFPRARTA
ncbi:MAG: hypothetical protein IPJ78_03400 [Gemmatimonadetes bacterium]|nr:hypothetical protein [Gemmatimonadota bacterium]